MSEPIIRVENLGKKYLIRHQQQEPYTALRDVITNGVKSLGGTLVKGGRKKLESPSREEFWALKDVSFEINRGDRVGIIGRNGAGKSTLLKILSRITEPTTGKINIKGRVASLLEVGTGFHPELTGRENIYLNGAILGMSKVEIKKKFDEIVAFAEVEKFLDTPIKRYSSGMYVRLAFAVAAHLETEILIVDEVLAVGDVAFQEKCLSKMDDISNNLGKTVLFVSHNTKLLEQLCDWSLVLEKGKIALEGEIDQAITFYLNARQQDLFTWKRDLNQSKHLKRISDNKFQMLIEEVEIITKEREHQFPIVLMRETFSIKIKLYNVSCSIPISIAFSIKNIRGDTIFTSHNHDTANLISVPIEKRINAICEINPNILLPGDYTINLGITDASWNTIEYVEEVIGFQVKASGGSLQDRRPGLISLLLDWHFC
ncbi:ABC transporter ATP-binding protein [Roseofilum sp. BLCC_M154]|uniref:ABC transporter ATP-binding protein n=1 Tax=Roseofilum acuticapitatum BLCC-M154 TaxID=3022444 RepID=A0ABT7AMJ2_9CYAN|nr:ABC transporter ATP-binding protein [Roseofilum acuticapitatum]MDJ1168117.1 ABC transporter ATP-binding protein [Roseofilum acuticapitatum BLCC-M154]